MEARVLNDFRGILLKEFPRRKELMRILHTRRKAEIEILTSGGSGSQVVEEPRGTSCLVHYICHRILHFVEMST